MAATSARPMIVVIDSFARLRNFTGPGPEAGPIGAETQKCLDSLEKIRQAKNCVPLGSDDPLSPTVVKEFYNPDDFQDFESYYDLPLPRMAEAAHTRGRPDGSVPERVRWQYHYLQTFFGGGTHYIVCENPNDAPDLSSLGPFRFITANGQGIMFPRLKQRIQAGKPASQSVSWVRPCLPSPDLTPDLT